MREKRRRRLTRVLPVVKKKPSKKQIKKESICYLKIHGYEHSLRIEEPKELASLVLQAIPNLSLWSHDALKNLYVGLNELTYTFCRVKSICSSGSRRAQYTRTMNKILSTSFISNDRLGLLCQIYNRILDAEGHSLLRGYGFASKFGDHLKGNPEFNRMSKVY